MPDPMPNPQSIPFDFEVLCPVDSTLLHVMRRFVSSVSEEVGFAPEEVAHIEMAVDEACSNVALHAYQQMEAAAGSGIPRIELKIKLEKQGMTIHIQDYGRGGQPDHFQGADSIQAYQAPEREDYHGLGILIMREFMDEVQFRAEPNRGTRVTLRKKLNPSA